MYYNVLTENTKFALVEESLENVMFPLVQL